MAKQTKTQQWMRDCPNVLSLTEAALELIMQRRGLARQDAEYFLLGALMRVVSEERDGLVEH
jgi:hypothetical protein